MPQPYTAEKKPNQISVRISSDLFSTLSKIETQHRIPPVELARGLLETAAEFYRAHGYFGFPVEVHPVSISHRIEAVAERPPRYPRPPK